MSKVVQNEITFKEYFDSKIIAVEKATIIAALGMEKRLEGMNEFRNTLRDQSSTFITRNEYQVYMEKVDDDIRMLRESKATLDGKASQLSTNIAIIIAIIGIVIATLGLFQKSSSFSSLNDSRSPTICSSPVK